MSNPIAAVTNGATAVVKAPVAAVKSRPVVWAIVFVLTAMVVIRYAGTIRRTLVRVPVVGPYLGRFMAAAALFLCATYGMEAGLDAALGLANPDALPYLIGGVGLSFPRPYHFDLKNDGSSTSVALTPGASDVSASFTVQGVSGVVGKAYKRAVAICGRLRVGWDQHASTGSAINWDQLPRIISGIEINSPLFGTMLQKESSAGPVLKHLIEYVGQGYRFGDNARAQLPAADGDVALDIYFAVPLAQQFLTRPHDSAPWVGWLDKTVVTLSVGPTTVLDSISTGGVIEATCNVQMWVDYVVDNDLEIPALPYWQLYTRAAASANSILIEGLGGKRALRNVMDYERLAGLFWHSDQAGMAGPDGFDNVTEVYMPALGIDRTVHVDAFFRSFRAYCIKSHANIAGAATTILHDGAGGYELIAGGSSSLLNSSTAKYLPIVAPCPDSEITKMPKVAGDVELTARFTTTPSSGSHRFSALSFREFDRSGRSELLQRAGLTGAELKVALADGSDLADISDWSGANASKMNNPRRFAGLPAKIARRGV